MSSISLSRAIVAICLVVFILAQCADARSKKDRKNRRHRGEHMKLKDGHGAVDPVKSWLAFVKQSSVRRGQNYIENRKRSSRKGKKYLARNSAPQGPPGPPGPQGPPGPPGAIITEAAMVAEFRNLVRDTAERRAARFAGQPLGLMAAGVPDVISAYFVLLRRDAVVHKKSKKELNNYEIRGAGTFIRGIGVQLLSGRFIAPYTAIYRFQASLHIGRAKDVSLKPRDAVSVKICINSDCDKNVSLKYRSGLSSNARIFTVHVEGLLYLMASQYTSVMLINHSSNTVVVNQGSSFSGYLVGA
eukprot:Seg1825.5 transcript_id=Seg1825.5/GoldUCD/mRNA.D3Y31 product=Adipolin protein_id=Seg1825.5/GoldUCD/D3Y31